MVIGVFTDGQVSGDLLPSLVLCFPDSTRLFSGLSIISFFGNSGPCHLTLYLVVAPVHLFGVRLFVRRFAHL